jgi:hypothetical protein
MFYPVKNDGRLFHDQIILYGFDPFDAPYDLTRFIHGLLRIDEAAQLNDAFVRFNTDLEGLEKIIFRNQSLYLGRNDRIVNVFSCAFMCACRCAGCKGGDQHKKY